MTNGTFDQGGNVWEWNEQIVDGSDRGMRGGSWNTDASDLTASKPSSSARFFTFPSTGLGFNGFRVASVPTGWVFEPGTSLLVMTGLAALAANQRRP